MQILSYAASGYAGSLVAVEVDIRRGIPGLDIVGLPDSAVRESRERVRVALKRSGYDFPVDRILVNLSPAGIRKEGASYDLPIALGILSASGQVCCPGTDAVLCAGELCLDGSVREVSGVLPSVAAALSAGVRYFIVPRGNLAEASTISGGYGLGIVHLRDLQALCGAAPFIEVTAGSSGKTGHSPRSEDEDKPSAEVDLSVIRGQMVLRRAMEIAAAGGHHLLLFGPPGSGKTLAARAFGGILPDLKPDGALEVTRIWSQAGRIGNDAGLLVRPPFREPHHSASAEGLIGGGSGSRPGEVSLAHGGTLFLDEAPEFGPKVLQSLREPLESGRVELARAGRAWWYPADFQLLLAMNPCPCGNLGREEASCMCTPPEIHRYWRRLGGALLDRVDIRVPVAPLAPDRLLEAPGESSTPVRTRVLKARERQYLRYGRCGWHLNSDVPPGSIERFIPLDSLSTAYFTEALRRLRLSSRAAHSVLRVARTIADLDGRGGVESPDVLEALQHRRYGDRDLFWTTL